MTRGGVVPVGLLCSLLYLSSFPPSTSGQILPELPLKGPQPTTLVIRVVAHGGMVLGREVGGARVTITDRNTGQILASGVQQGEAGDQNQIMRTPHMMEEPIYSTRPSASFTTTLELDKPTMVEITAEGPLAYPNSLQHATTMVWLIPGQNLTQDGIVLHLYGYLVQIERPQPHEPLMAKDDVKLRASLKTLSGTLVRPHGDWDSRKIRLYGELLVDDHIIERLQLFYDEGSQTFEAPFFVPPAHQALHGLTVRVIATDLSTGNSGIDQLTYPIVSERVPAKSPASH